MENLHERSIEDSTAQIVLAEFKEHGDHQQLTEFEAISGGEVSPAITREIEENRRGMTHTLDCGNMGAGRMEALCTELEESVRPGGLSAVPELISSLEEEVPGITADLIASSRTTSCCL